MTHKWNYKYPTNAWERMPWWLRWTVGIMLVLYFGGGLIAGTVALLAR